MKPSASPQVDHYIEQAAGFAKPVLIHLRALVHLAVPEIQETIKWGMPMFAYQGNVCHIAAFKQHCSFGLEHAHLLDYREFFVSGTGTGMGQLGKFLAVSDLPDDDVIVSCIRQAAQLNEQGVKPGSRKIPKAPLPMPADFAEQLKSSPEAQRIFSSFAPGYQRDYIEWITQAKTVKTRQKRLDTSLEWITAGKHRNWKYET